MPAFQPSSAGQATSRRPTSRTNGSPNRNSTPATASSAAWPTGCSCESQHTMGQFPSPAQLPEFKVRLSAPDIAPWITGNTGIRGITTRDSGQPGPHVALLSLMHGNELAGAIVLADLLLADLTPTRGKLSFGFLNLTAFGRFDPQRPTASRFLDEDMN